MTPQVVAASMVLSAALSLQLQYHPFVDDDHNFLESIGLHACLVQLLVALLSNTVGKIDDSTLLLTDINRGSHFKSCQTKEDP